MKKDIILLTYYQVIAFMYRIDEMRKENQFFNDGISQEFEYYVIQRTEEIVSTYPQLKLKIFYGADKYKISKSMFDYLNRLTGINPLDEETIKKYIPLIQEVEDNTREKFEEGLRRK